MSTKKEHPKKRESSASSGDSSSNSEAGDASKNTTPSSDVVLSKYMMAADIVNAVLKELIAEAKEGAEVGHLCSLGDKRLTELTAKTFKNQKDVQKGIAMPTCVSVDNCVCHYSPLASEPPVLLKAGQMVKLDFGAHIDGYIALVGHTLVVGASKDAKVADKKARVLAGAYNAMEMVVRMLRPEKALKNTDITEQIGHIAKLFGATPVENMLSHQLERMKINGAKQIIQNPGDEQKSKAEKCTFEPYEVYAIDVLLSTGEGKPKANLSRTTVYKKTDDFVYSLKMKTSRAFYSEAQRKFGLMPFSLRNFDNERDAKMGVVECERHGLMQPYQVFHEREGEYVAQFRTTAILMPTGIFKITGLPLDWDAIDCDVKIDDEKISALLKEPLKPKKKKEKGGEKKENEGAAAAAEEKSTA